MSNMKSAAKYEKSHARTTLILLVFVVLFSGCATSFSPGSVRQEIFRQTGQDPRRALEVDLGRFTTGLIKQVFAAEGGDVPFAGLAALEFAVYEVDAGEGPVLDVTLIPVRGWESPVKMHDETRSGMVLVRGTVGRNELGEEVPRLADLVVMGSGPTQVVYARLRGQLDPSLPEALGDVIREDGAEGLRSVLSALADGE
jgi:hypothetical protein